VAGSLQRVLPSDALEPGEAAAPALVRARVGDADVLLCRLEDGAVVAFCATCPHQETSLEEASFFDGKLRCARHLYLYDPRTGENVIPAREARPESLWKLKPGYLPVYKVEERDGWIWVSDTPEPPPRSYDPARELRPGTPGAADPAAPVPEPAPAARTDDGPERHRARVGDLVDLVIAYIPAPSHLWRLEGAGTVVALEGDRFEHTPVVQHRFQVRARAAGEVELRATYAMPWGGTPREVRTFRVVVDA